MNINEVYQLIDRFESSSLSELSLEMEGVKLSAKKGLAGAAQTVCSNETYSPEKPVWEQINKEAAKQKVKQDGKLITAPLVGTFYRAAGPGEKPFIEKGQQIKKGDVIGIIEAMKLMNEITASEDGIVAAIDAEDGAMVEYGEILVRME